MTPPMPPAPLPIPPALAPDSPPPVAVVVIGRNEGERLHDCLRSLQGQGKRLIYVDSGSTDGSQARALDLGAELVELDLSQPFSMARARNAGLTQLREYGTTLDYIHFIDGDCVVAAGWVAQAWTYLCTHPQVAAVGGRRRERFPEHSLYNAMADQEWNVPPGRVSALGGDALYRVSALAAVGGFNAALIAGEEPELCWRLGRAGWEIHRIDAEMTLHDARILRFGQWWQRMVRGGYGSLDVFRRCRALEPSGSVPFAAMVTSTWRWTLGWAGVALALAVLGALWAGAAGVGLALLLMALAWLAQAARIAFRSRSAFARRRQAAAFGLLTLVGKWAQLWGHLRYVRDLRAGRAARLIEYKESAPQAQSAWQADRARYPQRALWREQSLWVIAIYRFGQWNDRRRSGPSRWFFERLYWLLFRILETLTGISFTKDTRIGPGLRIHHFGNIFIHSKVRIGAGCTLRQGVTIGNRSDDGPVPWIEDEVEFGAYAQVLGGVRVGRGARIGAMTLVLQDVPPGYRAVGVPARLLPPASPDPPAVEATASAADVEATGTAGEGREAHQHGKIQHP